MQYCIRMCPHTFWAEHYYYCIRMCPHTTMRPHTTVYVSSYYTICVSSRYHIVSSYYYICVLILQLILNNYKKQHTSDIIDRGTPHASSLHTLSAYGLIT
jgi:hypothetical protein